jgi:beta-glucosidase
VPARGPPCTSTESNPFHMTAQQRDPAARQRFPSAESVGAMLPSGLIVGVSTSAFQIEGATRDGGRGESVWDTFSHESGRIAGGATADVTSDHYHRIEEDTALIRDLGADAYGFSFSWSRVQPGGRGRLNADGVAFYDRLLDGLLTAQISPSATLFHWDTPEELTDSWQSRDTAGRFGDLAFQLGERFGDRVDRWTTLHEPGTLVFNGYVSGVQAPGERLGLAAALPVAHNLLVGHGLAVQALRGAGVRGGIGLVNSHTPVEATTSDDDDTAAAWFFDAVHNRIFADSVLLGTYPQVPDHFARALASLADVDEADLRLISQPLDFYGVTYDGPTRVGAAPLLLGRAVSGLPYSVAAWPEFPVTGSGASIAPEYLEIALVELATRYGAALPPLFLTSLGAGYADVLRLDDRTGDRVIADSGRIGYLEAHVEAAVRATGAGGQAAGVDLRGITIRNLLDGFEFEAGFTQRTGLVHVDFSTQERSPKQSYRWLQAMLGNRT